MRKKTAGRPSENDRGKGLFSPIWGEKQFEDYVEDRGGDLFNLWCFSFRCARELRIFFFKKLLHKASRHNSFVWKAVGGRLIPAQNVTDAARGEGFENVRKKVLVGKKWPRQFITKFRDVGHYCANSAGGGIILRTQRFVFSTEKKPSLGS